MPRGNKSSKGTVAAFGERKNRRAKARFLAAGGLKVAARRRVRARPDFLEFTPAVSDEADFAALSTRASCYLGDSGIPLFLPGPRFSLDASTVPFFEPSLVRDPGWLSDRPSGRSQVIVHRLTPTTATRLLTERRPTTVVDEGLHASAELEYFHVRNAWSWPTYKPAECALEMLRCIPNPNRRAFILATGPSAQTVDLASVDADIRITCNSAVRDLERIRAFRPNVIACTDPVFHFGPSRYAAQFRKDLVRAAESEDAIVLCGSEWAGPMLGLQPELRDRLAVIPLQPGGAWRWPASRDPTVRPGSSVLTTLMLPVAFMLADDISVAGADGRQSGEKYFWTHSPKLQYSDSLMQTVFDAHPSFFRDRDYADYYEGYCDEVASLITVGEAAGKSVRGVTPSWIPGLRARGAPEPARSPVVP